MRGWKPENRDNQFDSTQNLILVDHSPKPSSKISKIKHRDE